MTAGGAAPVRPTTPADPGAAIRRAQAEIARAVAQAGMERDPTRPALQAFGAGVTALGELHAALEASRVPLDDAGRAELVRRLVSACRADFARAITVNSRRQLIVTVLWASSLVLSVGVGGYLLGRQAETAEMRAASVAIYPALADGSASARVWADVIRRNDVPALLARCMGAAVRTDPSGRQVCSVPLWLDDARALPASGRP